jgi:hypothetical protein
MRVHLLGGRGIEAVVAIDHTRGNQVSLRWLLYDGHGNLVRTMASDRFIDPARDGVNWYLYTDGNPIIKADVDGKRASIVWTAILLSIWGVVSYYSSPSNPYLRAAKSVVDGALVALGLIDTIHEIVAYSPRISGDPRLPYVAALSVYALAGASAIVVLTAAYQLLLIVFMATQDDPYWEQQAGDPLSYFRFPD